VFFPLIQGVNHPIRKTMRLVKAGDKEAVRRSAAGINGPNPGISQLC